MGMRQPARPSFRPAYGLPGVDSASTESARGAPSGAIPLLILVVLLAAATAWFVVRPMLESRSEPQRKCEVIVLASGTTKCVHEPARASRAAHAKSTSRAKR